MGTTKKPTAGGQPQHSKPVTGDPLNVNARLYNQIGRLLDDLEADDRDDKMTTPQRISALIAVGRILTIFASLRKGLDDGSAGSTVRRYAEAFKTGHGTGGRAHNSRSTGNVIELDSGSDDDDPDAA